MRKICAMILSIMMVLALVPSMAFATTSDSGQNIKSGKTTLALPTYTVGTGDYTTTFTQEKVNYKKMVVKIPNYAALKSAGITKVEVSASIAEVKKQTQSIAASFNMEFNNYGKFDVTVIFYKGSTAAKTVKGTASVVADEYNIAPIVATFPVTYFSLILPTITKNSAGDPIPTLVSLQRPDAWDWDKLPANVYGQPNLTKTEVKTQTSFANKVAKFATYIKDLYNANKNAKFHLYINDAYEKYILQLMCANGIPESQFDVVLLSDGSGSYANFNKTFNVSDPQTKYNQMAAGWVKAKKYAYDNGSYSLADCPYYSSSSYSAVVANENTNVSWWVGRKSGTFLSTDPFIAAKITPETNVLTKNMNTMLQALDANSQTVFKTLYKFNDQMFAKAEKEGKKVMLILGTRTTIEPDSGKFTAYAKFLQTQYGDDYVYYYKGHPATPTALYPDKQKELDSLGIIDVESSIPAELILYFYPKIYMAGYSSTTFQSVASDEQAAGVFGMSKKSALADATLNALATKDAFNFYMYNFDEASDNIAKTYVGCDNSHDNYIIDFSAAYLKSQGNKYTVAVYDSNDNMLYYYKLQSNGTYKLVSASIGDIKSFTSSLSSTGKSVKLSWSKLNNVSGYEIQYRSKYNGVWKTTKTTATSKTINLKVGQTIDYRVRAYIKAGGEYVYGSYTKTACNYANRATLDKVTLSYKNKTIKPTWKKVNSSYGKIIYQVYYKKNDGQWAHKNTTKLTSTLSKLPKTATYQIKIRTVKSVGGKNYYGAFSKTSYRYVSTGTIKKLARSKAGTMKATVYKYNKTTGYEYTYSRYKSFKSSKSVKVKGASTTTKTITNLSKGKKYYVKVRTYKIKSGKTYTGAYSSTKTITV